MTLFLFSCSEDGSIELTAEQEAEIIEFVQEFDQMSADEQAIIRAQLLDFYAVATVNNCEIGNFGILTPEELEEYARSLGHDSLRSFHDWSVEYGKVIREISKNNIGMEEIRLIDELISGQLIGSSNSCVIEMHTTFAKKSLDLANSFGAFITGSGFRQIEEGQLLAFGGAFNTFVRMQDLKDTCSEGDNLSK